MTNFTLRTLLAPYIALYDLGGKLWGQIYGSFGRRQWEVPRKTEKNVTNIALKYAYIWGHFQLSCKGHGYCRRHSHPLMLGFGRVTVSGVEELFPKDAGPKSRGFSTLWQQSANLYI